MYSIILAEKVNINNNIRSLKLRVIGHTGENLGVLTKEEALAKAKALLLDLIEVSPNANPPVCKITDYGKSDRSEASGNPINQIKYFLRIFTELFILHMFGFRPGTGQKLSKTVHNRASWSHRHQKPKENTKNIPMARHQRALDCNAGNFRHAEVGRISMGPICEKLSCRLFIA